MVLKEGEALEAFDTSFFCSSEKAYSAAMLFCITVFVFRIWQYSGATFFSRALVSANRTKWLFVMVGTVLCKSNDSEFRRISTKFYEILRKSAKFRGERIFGEISVASIVSPLTKFRADVRNFTWQIR